MIYIGIGKRNSEVISIRAGEKIVGLGECGDKDVEQGRGTNMCLEGLLPWNEKRWRG